MHDEGALFGLGVEGDGADRGGSRDLLGVARGAHAVVESGAQHRDADAESEADERAEGEVERHVRARGFQRGLRVADSAEADGARPVGGLGLELRHDARQARGDGVGNVGGLHRVGVGGRDGDEGGVEGGGCRDVSAQFGCRDAEVELGDDGVEHHRGGDEPDVGVDARLGEVGALLQLGGGATGLGRDEDGARRFVDRGACQ